MHMRSLHPSAPSARSVGVGARLGGSYLGSWHASPSRKGSNAPLPPRQRTVSLEVCAALGKQGKKGASKERVVFVCSSCGEDSSQQWGKCPSCGEWNTLTQLRIPKEVASSPGGAANRAVARASSGRPAAPASAAGSRAPRPAAGGWVEESEGPQRLRDVGRSLKGGRWRMPLPGTTGREIGRVLGGGVVPGSLVLVGGDPGVGKSTLMLQLAALLSGGTEEAGDVTGVTTGEGDESEEMGDVGMDEGEYEDQDEDDDEDDGNSRSVLYVSGEESVEQIYSRARRMGIDAGNMYLYSATRADSILEAIADLQPAAVVVDSIQTIFLEEASGSPGSVSQVRECATALLQCAKQTGAPIFLVGHVTKAGEIAGPRTLEHIVDVVLYMEGERIQSYRMLRGVKNRYGATDEVGVFEMVGNGLRAVANPSAMFLAHRTAAKGVSSAVAVTLEGTRPLMVEIQALSQNTQDGAGPARRMGNGVDSNRLFLLLAVLSKRAKVPVYSQDVVVNVVGGLTIKEPSADLAITAAIVSSVRDLAIPEGTAFVGEIGLGGELRPVPQIERRIAEAAKLGFTRVIIPAAGTESMALDTLKGGRHAGVAVVRCEGLRQALTATFPRKSSAKAGDGAGGEE